MLTLAIETSNPSAWTPDVSWRPGVCIGESEDDGSSARLLGVEPIKLDKPNADDLLPAIDRLMRRLGLAPHQLHRIAVSVGPGGFTAIRIAVAASQMIAEATGAQPIAVPSALVIAARAPRDIPAPFAVALSSKGTTAHLTIFSVIPSPSHRLTASPSQLDTRRPIPDSRLISAPDLPSLSLRALIADRFLPDDFRTAAAALNIPIHPPVFDPAACFEVSLQLDPVDPAQLLPIYPREPEAVTKWRALQQARAAQSGSAPKPR